MKDYLVGMMVGIVVFWAAMLVGRIWEGGLADSTDATVEFYVGTNTVVESPSTATNAWSSGGFERTTNAIHGADIGAVKSNTWTISTNWPASENIADWREYGVATNKTSEPSRDLIVSFGVNTNIIKWLIDDENQLTFFQPRWEVVTNWTATHGDTTLLSWDGGKDLNVTVYHESGIIQSNLVAIVAWKGAEKTVVLESVFVGVTFR